MSPRKIWPVVAFVLLPFVSPILAQEHATEYRTAKLEGWTFVAHGTDKHTTYYVRIGQANYSLHANAPAEDPLGKPNVHDFSYRVDDQGQLWVPTTKGREAKYVVESMWVPQPRQFYDLRP